MKLLTTGTLMLGLILGGLSADANPKKAPMDPRQELKKERKIDRKKECPEVTASCRICADGTKWNASGKKQLAQTDFACASGGKPRAYRGTDQMYFSEAKKENCSKVSSFCAVCRDDSVVSIRSGKILSNDFYECVSGPRTWMSLDTYRNRKTIARK